MGFFNFSKRPKYKNKKVEHNGVTFDSKKERDRYLVLKDAENKGLISNLERQVKFILVPAIRETYVEQLKTKERTKERTIQKAITYTCDFAYFRDGEYVVEDVKASPKQSALDKSYVLKKKMMLAFHGIFIKEVYTPNESI